VIIEQVDLRGFGGLRDRVFTFSSSVNVVVGPNEAGKSTLFRAIQALLYGHFQDSGVWAGDAVNSRFRPWSGAEYAGTVHVRLASGARYRIERHFDDERTAVFRDPGETDVTATYDPGPHGWVEFTDRHLGLTPSVFRAGACIQQDDLALVGDDAEMLHARLKLLADSGGTEQNAQDALSTLDAWLDDQLRSGPQGSENTALERGEVAASHLRDRLKRSRDALNGRANLTIEAMRWTEAEASIRRELQGLNKLIAWHEAKNLEVKLRTLADVEGRLTDRRAAKGRFADAATLTDAALDQADRALVKVIRLRVEVERLAEQARREEDDRSRTNRNLLEVDEGLNRLALVLRATLAEIAAAQSAVESWDSAASQLRGAMNLLASAQRRSKDADARRDVRLNRLSHVTIDELQRAVHEAVDRLNDLETSERRIAEHPAESVIQEEYQALRSQLHGLSADELTRMRTLETDLKPDESRPDVKEAPPIRQATAIGAIVGLAVGYGLFETIGAAVGTVGLGAATYGLMSLVSARRATATAIRPAGRILLDKWLAEYRAQSVDELQQRWELCSALQEQLAEAHNRQQNVVAARRASSSALEDLKKVSSTRDVEFAKQILVLMEAWLSQKSELDRSEAEAHEAIERAERGVSKSQAPARAALQPLEIAAADPVQAQSLLDGLRADQERRAAFVQRQSELLADQDRLEKTTQALAEQRGNLDSAEAEARKRLAAVGVARTSPDSASDLAERRKRLQAYREATSALEEQEHVRQALVGGDDPHDWSTKLAEQRSLAATPTPDDTRTLDDLYQEAQRLRGDLDDVRTRLAQIETGREQRLPDPVEPAELEEELAAATASLARLRYLSKVIQEARSLVETTADEYRRSFAPRLADSVSRWVDQATNHRYARAEVSPVDLSVTLASHERGGLIALDQVSRGTRDAVALLFRASVADLLSNTGEPVPLFLDDPLVHVDPERSRSIIEIICELGLSRQIFYGTQDPRIASLVRQRQDCCVYNLAGASK
jgi:DNA repair exonuclease SbcCD ATPase subunit